MLPALRARFRAVTPSIRWILLCWVALLMILPAAAKDDGEQPRLELGSPVTPSIFDGDVRDLPRPREWRPGDPIKEIPRRVYPKPGTEMPQGYPTGPDPLLQAQREAAGEALAVITVPSRNFPGQGYTGVSPPDTVGDVGPNHYIQSVNSGGGARINIYDKAEPVPSLLATFDLDTLGTGFCATGYGDPIVLYDRSADRWLLSEFSSSGNTLCVYISQTPDPVAGGWFHYGFTAPSFPDYPKYGVWATDRNGGAGSYIVTANDGGPGIYALNRGAMLTGAASTFQRVTVPGLPGFGFESLTPADADGPEPPPMGSPAIIMRHRDTEVHSGPAAPADLLEMWGFDVDWVTPANSLLITEPSIDVAEFDSDLCGLTSFYCFQQPGTSTTLDPLREVIMLRVQYYVHDDHESLVGSFVVDVDTTDHGGVRWFELRRSGGGGWTLYQEGTYSIDDDSRWMPPSAMDQSGNIVIGYNVSSSSTFPSLRYTGRLADDPLGVMTVPETSIHAGTASSATNRYGDYAAMSLDPADDCTFWFTGEDNTSSSWRTQIASFRFEACGCELAPLPPPVDAMVNGDNRIDVSWDDSELTTVTEYLVRRSRTPGGPYDTIATVPDTSLGMAGGDPYTYVDTDVSGGIAYYYIVVASDGGACKSDPVNEVSAVATGLCTLAPLFGGLQSVETPFFGTCTLDLTWNEAASECGGSLAYNVYRSQSQGFLPGPGNLIAGGVVGTTLTDIDQLVSGMEYFYIVRAADLSNGTEDGNLVERSGFPLGELTTGTWIDDGGDTGPAKMIPSAPWSLGPTGGNAGPGAYRTGDYGNGTCAALTTPDLYLGTGSQLTFYSKYDIETGWDKGEVQISTNGGMTWERLEVGYPVDSIRASDACGLPPGTYFTGSDSSWGVYGADLSVWGGQWVRLRFLMSSDVSVTGSGWWIDDITITQVDVPGACATGSACTENPFVDVEPEGPLTVCLREAPALTATTSGGSGTFSYQWTDDGVPIPGATASTLVPEPGTHRYNCEVKSDSCSDVVRDGMATEVTAVDAPFFEGLGSAFDPQSSICSVQLAWNAASTVCAGPVKYFVYRDTVTPVTATPDHLVASNLATTTWTDTAATVFDTTYYYLVRALDQSTLRLDDNTVEMAAAPTGPGTGTQIVFQETFETSTALDAWTLENQPASKTCGQFSRSTLSGQRPATGSGGYVRTYGVGCSNPPISSTLTSPSIPLDLADLQTVTLDFDLFYHYGAGGDQATVEVWDGANWQLLWQDPDADQNGHLTFDVTSLAAGNPDFRVRFFHDNVDQWLSFDNVTVTAEIVNVCSTRVGPPPAPDGLGGTGPLTVAWETGPGGPLQLTWDAATCTAADYHLLFGDLAGVGDYTLTGAECSLGATGSFGWDGIPAGDLFFLIVGTDGAGTESSWGLDGVFGERNGPAASGWCGSAAKDTSGSCP